MRNMPKTTIFVLFDKCSLVVRKYNGVHLCQKSSKISAFCVNVSSSEHA